MDMDQISALLLTSSFLCWSVGGLRFVDILHSPLFPYIVTAFILEYHPWIW